MRYFSQKFKHKTVVLTNRNQIGDKKMEDNKSGLFQKKKKIDHKECNHILSIYSNKFNHNISI